MANTFYSTQDIINPDVNALYNQIIKEIDKFRSTFAVSPAIDKSIADKNLEAIIADGGATMDSYQESRCHTFFRMMGLPVVNGEGTALYSPGFDPSLNKDEKRRSTNLDIAKSSLEKFKDIFNERETYAKNRSEDAFFAQDESSTINALGITFPRPFDKQIDPGISPIEVDRQIFEVSLRNALRDSGEFPDTFIDTTSKHIVKPLSVDPRVELTVTPAVNRICAPFLEDKSKTQLLPGTYLKRPYIEKVISTRFKKTNTLSANNQTNVFLTKILEFIKNNTDIKDPDLVSTTGSSSLHSEELIAFSKIVRLLESLTTKLVNNISNIGAIKTKINWKPIPDPKGLESGIKLNDVIQDDPNNKHKEQDIVKQRIRKFIAETNVTIGLNKPDLGGFTFSGVDDIIFGGNAVNGAKKDASLYDKQINRLEKERNELGTHANNFLREIEIITGEFSGFGLLDVLAIQAALWVISPKALISLVDEAAINRLKLTPTVFNELDLPEGRISPLDALKEFEKKLSEIYVLIQGFYNDVTTGVNSHRQ